jgi:hypothetical protein
LRNDYGILQRIPDACHICGKKGTNYIYCQPDGKNGKKVILQYMCKQHARDFKVFIEGRGCVGYLKR